MILKDGATIFHFERGKSIAVSESQRLFQILIPTDVCKATFHVLMKVITDLVKGVPIRLKDL